MRKWFPEVENSRLMKVCGMTHSTFHRFAQDMGLTKSARGLRGIRKRHAAHIKKLCEANGYYDSLRGKPMSEAARQGLASLCKDIREGRREHAFKILKRENPRKYQQMLKRKSEARKELIRKEKFRAAYGLTRHTKLKAVVLHKYTKSQTRHRSSAIRRGYLLMEDCSEQSVERYNIYYDSETQRSALFEQNLTADGFRVIEWKE